MLILILTSLFLLILLRGLYQAKKNPLHIIWDLDGTIISSHTFPKAHDFDHSIHTDYFDQIDDDFEFEENINNTRTWFRPFSKKIIKLSSYFAYQHIFTAAQETYTENVLEGLKEHRTHFKIVKNRDMYPKRHLRINGKNILEIITEDEMHRTIFLDDQPAYLKPHLSNGILVPAYGDIHDGKNDRLMLKLFSFFLLCLLVNDVRPWINYFFPKKDTKND